MNVRDNEVFTPIDLIKSKKTLSSVIIILSLNKTNCLSLWTESTCRDNAQKKKIICARTRWTLKKAKRAGLRQCGCSLIIPWTFMSNWNTRGTKHWFDFISWVYAKVNGMFLKHLTVVSNGVKLDLVSNNHPT
jgi:hypothetical protein